MDKLPQVNFSDFNRFATSIGLIMFILGLIILPLFADFYINRVEEAHIKMDLNNLEKEGYTNDTIDIIIETQNSKIKILNPVIEWIPWLGLFLIIFGGILLFCFAYKWMSEEKNLYELKINKENMELKRIDEEIKRIKREELIYLNDKINVLKEYAEKLKISNEEKVKIISCLTNYSSLVNSKSLSGNLLTKVSEDEK